MTSENVALSPALSVAEQLIVPPEPGVGCVGQGKGAPLVCVMETKVIVPGSVSVREMLPLSGPLFPAVIINVTSVLAAAVLGPSLVTNKSVSATMVTVAFPESLPELPSAGVLEAVAVLENTVPGAVPRGTFTRKVKFALAPLLSEGMLQVMVPFVPPGGFEQLKAGPVFCVSVAKVIPAGRGSVNCTAVAAEEPLLLIVTLNGTWLPGVAVDGADFATVRSGCANAAGARAIAKIAKGRRTKLRVFTAADYSNLSRAVYSRPCDSATALYVIFPS